VTFNPYFDAKPSFEPTDIVALQGALDDACKALEISPDARQAREIIAARIFDLARDGMVERKSLSERVVQEARTVV